MPPRDSSMISPLLISDIVPMWAALAPDRTALVDGARSWTYDALSKTVCATAAWLERSGVRPGDRLMLVCENCCAAVAIYLACAAIGAWPVVVNARLSNREIDEIREHSGARRVVVTVDVSVQAKGHGARLGAVLDSPADFGTVAITELNEVTRPESMETDKGKGVAALIYTSGTTGRPKGVMLSHENLLFVAHASGRARGLTPEDRVYAVLPVSHILGLTGVLLGSLVFGATVYLTPRFDPGSVLSALERDRLSVMIGTPSMFALLAEYAGRKKLTPISGPSLRLISSAGAPLDAATKSTTETAFGRVLHNGYGITECSPTIALTDLNSPRADCAVGSVLPGIAVRFVGPDGSDVRSGEPGELWVRGPGVMKGYYNAADDTANAIDGDGWFKTGDLARLEDGNLFIVGRCKELIIRFGFNVYPAEVEGVLNTHAGVARSAVIGREIDGSEEVLAFVQPVPGSAVTSNALQDFAASKLAPYKRPSAIFLVSVLPMSPAGKILKSELSSRGRQGSKLTADSLS